MAACQTINTLLYRLSTNSFGSDVIFINKRELRCKHLKALTHAQVSSDPIMPRVKRVLEVIDQFCLADPHDEINFGFVKNHH